ncbi:hypothetical protein CONLIGDRAFT_685751 [Coniochaeta ligniaria NRRL 30616]|uniref:Uncharacterized protein n=1 Tax=Coniochaeta ligniaria NRRL 30616 TaxID=1408157 RepID=A0A1J7I9J2_9PEZI|nr:hypothetical protein CONLIGDRAFT_685751 [Coniochaeta ligniaria NRRL 30616]
MASIGIAVDALVDRAPDKLLNQSLVSITKLYSNMSDSGFDTAQISSALALESGARPRSQMEATPKIDSPSMVPKWSQLGQLLDLTGNGVSQQTIVIDNFNTRCGDIMISIKQVTVNIMRESVLAEAAKFINTFTEQYKTIYGLIEDVCAALLGPPALFSEREWHIHDARGPVPAQRGWDDHAPLRVRPSGFVHQHESAGQPVRESADDR